MTQRIVFIGMIFFLVACAGRKIVERPVSQEIKLDQAPNEFQEKFKVQDVEALPEAKAPPVVQEKKLAKKQKKATPREPAAFVYPNRRPPKDPIWIGEKQVLEVTFLGMPAGTFAMEVLPHKEIAGRKVYHFKGHARSSSLFSVFYSLDDVIESFMDYDGLFSHRFQLLFNESGQTRNSVELYDSEKRQTFYHNQVNRKETGFSEDKLLEPMDPFPQDMMSFLYYLRMVHLPEQGEVKFPVVTEGKTFEAIVTVVRRDFIDSPLGRVRAVVVRPETKFKDRWEKRGDNFIWLSDDDRRFILMVDFKVKIGSVKARMIEVQRGQTPSSL